MVDVADAKGDWKEPSILSMLEMSKTKETSSRLTVAAYLKDGENAAYETLPDCFNDVEIMPI